MRSCRGMSGQVVVQSRQGPAVRQTPAGRRRLERVESSARAALRSLAPVARLAPAERLGLAARQSAAAAEKEREVRHPRADAAARAEPFLLPVGPSSALAEARPATVAERPAPAALVRAVQRRRIRDVAAAAVGDRLGRVARRERAMPRPRRATVGAIAFRKSSAPVTPAAAHPRAVLVSSMEYRRPLLARRAWTAWKRRGAGRVRATVSSPVSIRPATPRYRNVLRHS